MSDDVEQDREQLLERLEQQEQDLAILAGEHEEAVLMLEQAADILAAGAGSQTGADGDNHTDWREWVRSWLAGRIHRPAHVWCARWDEHPEVASRLEALFDAWRQMWPSPGAARSLWWRDHFDHHFAMLTSEAGPMAECHHSAHVTLTAVFETA